MKIFYFTLWLATIFSSCSALEPHKVSDKEREEKLKHYEVTFSIDDGETQKKSDYVYFESDAPCLFKGGEIKLDFQSLGSSGILLSAKGFPTDDFITAETIEFKPTSNQILWASYDSQYRSAPSLDCTISLKKINSKVLQGSINCDRGELTRNYVDFNKLTGAFSCHYSVEK